VYSLEVDFDVYKAVFARRASETVSENDVLRELLGLGPKKDVPQSASKASAASIGGAEDWTAKGVRFPVNTEFRVTYKGQIYTGRVHGGALVVDGKSYESPSSAAMAITGSAVNGWRFWEARLPGKSSWQLIEGLRK
jgi:hypothetical protein